MIRYYILPLGLQIFCIIHLMRNSREWSWLIFIIFLPIAGSLVYIFMEIILPYIKRTNRRGLSFSLLESVNPDGKIRKLQEQVEFSPTFANKVALADGYLYHGFTEKAIDAYHYCLNGAYVDEPDVKFKLAEAYHKHKESAEAKKIIDELRDNNPDFKRDKVWLLYIQVLEGLDDKDAALNEFKNYINSYSNLESRCRFGLFLKRMGKPDKATHQFSQAINDAKHLPAFNLKDQKKWLRFAKNELRELEKQA